MRRCAFFWSLLISGFVAAPTWADIPKNPAAFVKEHYTKKTFKIPVRDGVHLHTIVYSPKDDSRSYPIMLMRTPYGVHPYEEEKYRFSLGPNGHLLSEGYIFAYQDVRGRYMSEGTFENVRPHNPKRTQKTDIDESTDTYDSIDFLIKNVPNNNGKVGMWGISYPGFYCSAGMIDAHPALKAVSPQAPIADWFFDDFFHHGAFFLPHAFNFMAGFGKPRPSPTTERAGGFQHKSQDGYQFFLDLGSLKNVNPKFFKGNIAYWNTMAQHPNYDEFWQARNLLPHLKNVAPAVMTVGGWFDAEDLYGALNTYQAVEKQNPKSFNVLIMGPWSHGGWARSESKLGSIHWGSNTSAFYQEHIELPFFNHFLKGKGEHALPEAYAFETGSNTWRQYPKWPPAEVLKKKLYFRARGKLTHEPPQDDGKACDSFVSDPNRPVPFTEVLTTGMRYEYMVEDQRFASRRPDVLVYQTGILENDLRLAGPLTAELFVSTSGTDSDWVVKVIDVFPDDARDPSGKSLAGYQMMVRSEVIRGRFRNSYSKPEAFEPDQVAKVSLPLQDVLHNFRKGHRLMVQVHSTWFPLVDRNPQKFVPNIFEANDDDFVATTNRVFRSPQYPSKLLFGILEGGKE